MKKNNFGFTLIELMIAIVIGLLMVGFGSIALNDFNEKQKIDTVKQDLLANLRLARNYAMTNQFPVGTLDGTDRVTVTINNGLMVAKAQWIDKNTKIVRDTGYSFFSKNITTDDISITVDNGIEFSITDGRSIDGVVNIIINGVIDKNIKIDESGLIYEKKDE